MLWVRPWNEGTIQAVEIHKLTSSEKVPLGQIGR